MQELIDMEEVPDSATRICSRAARRKSIGRQQCVSKKKEGQKAPTAETQERHTNMRLTTIQQQYKQQQPETRIQHSCTSQPDHKIALTALVQESTPTPPAYVVATTAVVQECATTQPALVVTTTTAGQDLASTQPTRGILLR